MNGAAASLAIVDELIAQDSDPLRSLPTALCQRAAAELHLGAAIVLQDFAGLNRLVAATPGVAQRAEQAQLDLAEGPGVDAVTPDGRPPARRGPVLRANLAADADRWPFFVRAATAAGVRAMFSFPLSVGSVRLGVLDLFRARQGPLTSGLRARAGVYAQACTLLLLHLQRGIRGSDELHPALVGAIADRAEIHQATGIVAVQLDLDIARAGEMLRARALADDRCVRDVAQDVLAHRIRFTPPGSADAREVRPDQG